MKEERELKTKIRWVIEYLNGKRVNGTYYENHILAEIVAPTPSVIWKVELVEL